MAETPAFHRLKGDDRGFQASLCYIVHSSSVWYTKWEFVFNKFFLNVHNPWNIMWRKKPNASNIQIVQNMQIPRNRNHFSNRQEERNREYLHLCMVFLWGLIKCSGIDISLRVKNYLIVWFVRVHFMLLELYITQWSCF